MIVENTNAESLSLTEYAVEDIHKNKANSCKRYDFYKLFWIFLIGSVIGFIIETMWHFVRSGRIECRSSMIIGPFTVVYGIGALVLYIGTKQFSGKNKILHIFVFGFISGSVVEYLCSLIQELLCGSVSWDYSNQVINIGGRICMLYSVFWGLLAVLWFVAIQPVFEKLISRIPTRTYKRLTLWLAVFILIDIAISIAAVARWGMRLDGMPANNVIMMMLDKLFPNEFMSTIYPNMLW